MNLVVNDANGVPIRVGARIVTDDPSYVGRVLQISDPDGDVDDEGRPVYYPPRVTVQYPDGGTEVFSTYWSASGWWDEDAPHVCDDIEVDTRMLPALTNCDPGDEIEQVAA